MGTELTGECECGYTNKVNIASGRDEHGKVFYFPHYCNSCDKLTSADLLTNFPSCNHCASTEIYSYAALTKTLPYNKILNIIPNKLLNLAGFHKSELVHEEKYCPPIKKTISILHGNHYCPRCKEKSMRFFTSMG